jgi:hypothetical protein
VLPPTGILIQIGYAAAVSAAALLVTWPWRERGSSAPVALGLGVAACSVVWRGFPEPWPVDVTERLLHVALLGAALGSAEARIPSPLRWAGRVAVAAGVAWALLLPADPLWKLAAVAGAFLVAWSALEWRASRVEGYGVPAALVVVAGAGAQALLYGHSALLAQLAGALAAAAAPLFLYAFLRPRLSLARGGVTAFTLVALPLWLCGWRLADLPLESAALLAVAPLAAQRRGWLGALVALAAAGFAVYLSYAANLPDPNDPYAGY